MCLLSRRDQLFQTIKNVIRDRTLQSVLDFFSAVYHFYVTPDRDGEISPENMSEEEKRIFRVFSRNYELASVLYGTRSVTEAYQLRMLLSGMVYYRIELHPLHQEFGVEEYIKVKHMLHLEFIVQLEWAIQRDIKTYESENPDLEWKKDSCWREDLGRDYAQYDVMYDAEYLLND
ncbi:hypothetical protein PFISCL1PPCAC_7869 [Pristionchus fissidentatus]|uniref:Uncharacterized protein n=1 Tax=Pristionchus fissidentatus TaxID=1538716 RepID=A0AAV5VEI9_9BILA|nr:hypothetical protein PFISCL1PPCAC_7869 [Pristionchus fissidentatus]